MYVMVNGPNPKQFFKLDNKCISKDRHLPGSSGEDLFCLLSNCFVLLCSNLAVLIFPTLFVDF